jgi:hypothetical protein
LLPAHPGDRDERASSELSYFRRHFHKLNSHIEFIAYRDRSAPWDLRARQYQCLPRPEPNFDETDRLTNHLRFHFSSLSPRVPVPQSFARIRRYEGGDAFRIRKSRGNALSLSVDAPVVDAERWLDNPPRMAACSITMTGHPATEWMGQ